MRACTIFLLICLTGWPCYPERGTIEKRSEVKPSTTEKHSEVKTSMTLRDTANQKNQEKVKTNKLSSDLPKNAPSDKDDKKTKGMSTTRKMDIVAIIIVGIAILFGMLSLLSSLPGAS